MRNLDKLVEDLGDGTATVSGACKFTGEEYHCVVPMEGLVRFLNGEPVQDVMPRVSADDREFLISGISPAGWKQAFG
jgi:hypothetical protein